MDLGYKGKTVIVTGGSSNINRGNVLTFAREGANVVCADIDDTNGPKVVDEANAQGGAGKTIFVKTDVTDWDSVQAMVKKTLDEFGQIDVLVNGVGWVVDKLFMEEDREKWQKLININFWSVINCSRAVLDHMVERKRGTIINIGSDAGRMGEFREAVYGGCKGAVIAMTKALAREMGRHNINVNCICPGGVIPEKAEHRGIHSLVPEGMGQDVMPDELKQKVLSRYIIKRLCTPQDIANAVVFIASDTASYITGQTLSVNGGYSMM